MLSYQDVKFGTPKGENEYSCTAWFSEAEWGKKLLKNYLNKIFFFKLYLFDLNPNYFI